MFYAEMIVQSLLNPGQEIVIKLLAVHHEMHGQSSFRSTEWPDVQIMKPLHLFLPEEVVPDSRQVYLVRNPVYGQIE